MGVERQGLRFSLSHIAENEWRAYFMKSPMCAPEGFGVAKTPGRRCRHAPMITTLVPDPFHRPGWVYEEKVDGWRILAYRTAPASPLVSRNGVEHARHFP